VRLRQMADAARDRGVPVILLVFPGENEVRRDYPDLVFAQKLREIWASTGFPIIDLLPLYRASLRAGENPFLPYDLHPNAVGMRIAADQLFEVIRAHRYLGVDGAEPLATAARR
jgi:lysophospholipase L1-like esterase